MLSIGYIGLLGSSVVEISGFWGGKLGMRSSGLIMLCVRYIGLIY